VVSWIQLSVDVFGLSSDGTNAVATGVTLADDVLKDELHQAGGWKSFAFWAMSNVGVVSVDSPEELGVLGTYPLTAWPKDIDWAKLETVAFAETMRGPGEGLWRRWSIAEFARSIWWLMEAEGTLIAEPERLGGKAFKLIIDDRGDGTFEEFEEEISL
jgi:hypothetical protein